MTAVLHVQKVSGVSGSEAHLLSVLPELRALGRDVRMLVLHEGEPGARDFVTQAVQQLRAWGYRTLKIDFLFGAALEGGHAQPITSSAAPKKKSILSVR